MNTPRKYDTSRVRTQRRARRSGVRQERTKNVRKLPAGLSFGGGIQHKTALCYSHQGSLDAQPTCNRRSAGEERTLGERSVTVEISKIPIGDLLAGAPAPAAIHNAMRLHSGSSAAHVLISQRRATPPKDL